MRRWPLISGLACAGLIAAGGTGAQHKSSRSGAKPQSNTKQMKPGTERWPVKTALSPQADVKHPKIIALAAMLKLGGVPGVKKNDARYQSKRIPKSAGMAIADGDIVQTSGYLWLVAVEPDGDYHIQISNSAASGDHCLIVEAPRPDPAYVADARSRGLIKTARDAIDARLFNGKSPGESVHLLPKPMTVMVTGQLFYDDAHVGEATARGKKGMHATNLWELHPLTDIRFASP